MTTSEIIKLSAHEVNSPIAVIHGYADLINSGIIKGEKAGTMAGKIKNEAKRLSKLVEEMAVFVGIKEGTIYAEKSYVRVKNILQAAVEIVKDNTKQEFYTEIIGDGEIYVNGELLRIMLTHIVENAVIYNESGKRKVMCKILSAGDDLSITIEDNGPGVKREEKEAVFECFYRENKEYSRRLGSNGMGLAICREIAGTENMDISIDDGNAGGACVKILCRARGKSKE